MIPPAADAELRRFHDALPDFIHVRAVSDDAQVAELLEQLDRGEAEAIVLA